MTADTALDTAALDAELTVLHEAAPTWVALPLAEKIALLEGLKPRVLAEASGMVEAAVRAKGYDPTSSWRAEEWITNPWAFLQGINALLTVLRRVAAGQEPLPASKVRTRPDGQTVASVFPATRMDQLLFHGVGADVWLEPGVTPEQARTGAASQYRGGGYADAPGVALVLGAGNVGTITTLDILDVLYADGQVAIAKMNPVNDYLSPFYERIFVDYVSRGFVRFVHGGPELGGYLTHHDLVDRVHMTGSARTHDAIVWGVGEDGERRRRDGEPLLTKPFTSELGGVSPTIVVPGEWKDHDLAHQAENIVTSKVNNSGHNCVAVQVLVLPEAWPQADALLGHVRALLRSITPRPMYYPGAADRVAAAAEGHSAERYADDTCVLVTDVDLDGAETVLEAEAFAGVLAVVRLPGDTVEAYLDNAVAFANDRLPGTLGASVIVSPETRKAHAGAVDRAIAGLRYGAIGVNAWSALAFLLGYTTWGAFPGNTDKEIGSGIGVVHNAFMLKDVQKTVAWMPFRPAPRSLLNGEYTLFPKPPFYVSHGQALTTAKRLTAFLATDDVKKIPGIFLAALRG